jgi:hypothetical protein
MAHFALVVWGLGMRDWSQEKEIMASHGDRGFLHRWLYACVGGTLVQMQKTMPPHATSLVNVSLLSDEPVTIVGCMDDIQCQEDARAAWCVVCFSSLTAAEACAAELQGACACCKTATRQAFLSSTLEYTNA